MTAVTHRRTLLSLAVAVALCGALSAAAGCRSSAPPAEEGPPSAPDQEPAAAPAAPPPAPAPAAEPAPEPGAAAAARLARVGPSDEPPPPGGWGYELLQPEQMSGDPVVRDQIEALRKAGNAKTVLEKLSPDRAKAVPALRNALRHPDSNVRIQGAQLLARLAEPSKETTDAFVAALLGDPNQEVRAAVGRELTEYMDPALVEPLQRSLAADPYGTARANAAWALGAQGNRKAADALVAALDDEETWVRLRSLTALKRLKAHKALPAVVERVKDPNSVVRERAVETLQKLTGKKIGEDYEKWKKVVK